MGRTDGSHWYYSYLPMGISGGETSKREDWPARLAIMSRMTATGWVAGLALGILWLAAGPGLVGGGLTSMRYLFAIGAALAFCAGFVVQAATREAAVRVDRKDVHLVDAHPRVERGRYLPMRIVHFVGPLADSSGNRLPRPLRAYLLCVLLLFGGFTAFYSFFPIFLSQVYGFGNPEIFAIYIASQVTSIAMYPRVAGWVSSRGSRPMQLYGSVGRSVLFSSFFLLVFVRKGLMRSGLPANQVSLGRAHPRRIWRDGPVHGPRSPGESGRRPGRHRGEERAEGQGVRRGPAGSSGRPGPRRCTRFPFPRPRDERLGLRDQQLLVRSERFDHGGGHRGGDSLLRPRRPVPPDAATVEARRASEGRRRDVRPRHRLHARDDERDGGLRCQQTRQGPQGPPSQQRRGGIRWGARDLRSPVRHPDDLRRVLDGRSDPAERKDPVRPSTLRARALRVHAARGRRGGLLHDPFGAGHHAEDDRKGRPRNGLHRRLPSGLPADD